MIPAGGRRPGDESGAVVVVVALGLLVIMAVAALVVDGGRIHDERSDAQIAADAAALAAAWADCTGGAATTAGLDAADANGYDDDGVTNDVSIYNRGGGWWLAEVDTTLDTTFAATQGVTSLSTAPMATASCRGSGSGYAIFGDAGACNPNDIVKLSGSNIDIVGDVHSNENGQFMGSDVDLVGVVSSVGTTALHTSATITPSADNPVEGVADRPLPVNYTMADFTPDHVLTGSPPSQPVTNPDLEAAGLLTPAGELSPGVYYAAKGFALTGPLTSPASPADGTTFLTDNGDITFSGSSVSLRPSSSAHGVLLMSERAPGGVCANAVIQLSSADSSWEGLVFAPNGGVTMSGAGINSLGGSIVAFWVSLSSANLTITYQDHSTTDPFVRLER